MPKWSENDVFCKYRIILKFLNSDCSTVVKGSCTNQGQNDTLMNVRCLKYQVSLNCWNSIFGEGLKVCSSNVHINFKIVNIVCFTGDTCSREV